jgi:ferredoxin
VRVVIDPVKCAAYGTCNEVCEAVFKLDDWGYAMAPEDQTVVDLHIDDVRRAVKECPTKAIALQD